MKCLNLYFTAFCILISLNVFGQTPQQIEADLLKSFKKIGYWNQQRDKDTSGAWGNKLAQANNNFGRKLKYYAEKYPATITDPFQSLLKEHLDISSSADGLFRIYSWDTRTGGTEHFFENVFQYKSEQKTTAIFDTLNYGHDDDIINYHKVCSFKVNDISYYLAIYLIIGSTKDVSDGIHIFTVKNGKLKNAKIIKTPSGLHSDLSYDYNFFSVVNIPFGKRPAIRFDNATNTIYLPLVDGNRNMTNKFILYKFTGQYFEKVKS
jgi:hypothetical protein